MGRHGGGDGNHGAREAGLKMDESVARGIAADVRRAINDIGRVSVREEQHAGHWLAFVTIGQRPQCSANRGSSSVEDQFGKIPS